MATIELSQAFVTGVSGFITRVFNLNANNPSSLSADVRSIAAVSSLLGGQVSGTPTAQGDTAAMLYIMKGVPPVSATAQSTFSSRSADVLCTYSTSTGFTGGGPPPTAGDFAPTVAAAVNPVVINTNYTFASASGTATWFWLITREVQSYAPTDSVIHQIIGTVGVTGSGADLEIPVVSISAGAAYRVLNLRLQFPTSWTY